MRVLAKIRQIENAPRSYHRTPSFLKAVFASILIFLMGVLQPVQAQNSISLSPEFTLNYESGKLDLNGGIIDVVNAELISGGEVLFTADTLMAEVDESNPENPILKMLDISGLSVEEDAIAISIAEISAINMPLNYNYQLSEQPEPEEILAYFKHQSDIKYRVAEIVIVSKEEGISITIDEIVIDVETNNRQAVDAAGSKTSYAVSNIVMSPYGNSNDASEYQDGLAQVGIDSLALNLNGVIESLYKDRRLAIRLYQAFDLPQLFDISWNLDMSFGHKLFELNAYLASNTDIYDFDNFDLSDDEVKGLLLANAGEILLHRFTVNLEDKGILAKAKNPEIVAPSVESGLDGMPEPIANLLRQPVTEFIHNGGLLAVDANPPEPANLLQLSTIMLAPEVAIQILGLSVYHQLKS